MIGLESAATRLVATITFAMTLSIAASCSDPHTEMPADAAVGQANEMATLAPQEARPEPTPLDGSNVAADEFPGLWGEDGFRDVAITLGRSHIRGCGEFLTRRKRSEPDRFLVYCTRDGENWTAHLVDVSTEEVLAIDTVPADIPKPY